MLIALIGVAAALPASSTDLTAVPMDVAVVAPAEQSVPIGDAVRAATWDGLSPKPDRSTSVHVAYIIMTHSGAPGACVPTAALPSDRTSIDWIAVRRTSEEWLAKNPAEAGLIDLAARRIHSARLVPQPRLKNWFAIRIFDETVSPADARPPYKASAETLTLNDVTFAQPIDNKLIVALFPTTAMRFGVVSKVVMSCTVTPAYTLMCRDAGTVQMTPADIGESTAALVEDLRFATYQLAGTLHFEPKSKACADIAGRNLRIAISWRMPE